MNVDKMINELREELQNVNEVILVLQRLHRARKLPPGGSPPGSPGQATTEGRAGDRVRGSRVRKRHLQSRVHESYCRITGGVPWLPQRVGSFILTTTQPMSASMEEALMSTSYDHNFSIIADGETTLTSFEPVVAFVQATDPYCAATYWPGPQVERTIKLKNWIKKENRPLQ
jgi:hypothetical protein